MLIGWSLTNHFTYYHCLLVGLHGSLPFGRLTRWIFLLHWCSRCSLRNLCEWQQSFNIQGHAMPLFINMLFILQICLLAFSEPFAVVSIPAWKTISSSLLAWWSHFWLSNTCAFVKLITAVQGILQLCTHLILPLIFALVLSSPCHIWWKIGQHESDDLCSQKGPIWRQFLQSFSDKSVVSTSILW